VYVLKEKDEIVNEKPEALTKDRLVGMKVIDGAGYHIGEVKDVAFTVGTTPVSMVMILKKKKGGDEDISWEEVQAAGDFVVLKPKSAAPGATATAATCSTCGGPLTYIQQYQRWYCTRCQKYV
jgi:sporulation protein YlmC with PRC-barrel domain